jgi:hypothetical protein
LFSVTLAPALAIWITSASADCISALLPLLTTSVLTPLLSRITRPLPVCLIVPRLFSVALLPVMVTATVLPLTLSAPLAVTEPV